MFILSSISYHSFKASTAVATYIFRIFTQHILITKLQLRRFEVMNFNPFPANVTFVLKIQPHSMYSNLNFNSLGFGRIYFYTKLQKYSARLGAKFTIRFTHLYSVHKQI